MVKIISYHEVTAAVVNFSQLSLVLELTNLLVDGVSCLFDFKASNCEFFIVAVCFVSFLQQILRGFCVSPVQCQLYQATYVEQHAVTRNTLHGHNHVIAQRETVESIRLLVARVKNFSELNVLLLQFLYTLNGCFVVTSVTAIRLQFRCLQARVSKQIRRGYSSPYPFSQQVTDSVISLPVF